MCSGVTIASGGKQIAEVSMRLTAILTPNELGGFTASNPDTGTTTQGATVEEALAHLKEATELYLEVAEPAGIPLSTPAAALLTTIEVSVRAAA